MTKVSRFPAPGFAGRRLHSTACYRRTTPLVPLAALDLPNWGRRRVACSSSAVFHRFNLLLLLAVLSVLLGGCTKDEDTDYCKNHYRFHDQHLDSIAALNIELNEKGILNSELNLPASSLSAPGETMKLLGQPANVYTLQSTVPCAATDVEVLETEGALHARYQSDCGSDNRLEQVNVAMFESLPALDEVIVKVTTPATAKLFAISRQCERAIFRLDYKPNR